jgi:very-short-patch-repair endonuclease
MKPRVPGYTYDLCRRLRQRQTEAEKKLWEYLRAKRLMGLKFRRQRPIGRYIADFYCAETHLAIELDGSVHDTKDQEAYDKIRQEIIEVRGIRVLRIRNEEIEKDIDEVLKKIMSSTSPP